MSGWQMVGLVAGAWAAAGGLVVLWFWAAKKGGEAYDATLAQHFDKG